MKLTKDFKLLARTFGEVRGDFDGKVYQSEDNIVSTNKFSIREGVFTGTVYTLTPKFGGDEYVVLGNVKLLTVDGFKTVEEVKKTLPNIMTFYVDTTPYGKRFLRMKERPIEGVSCHKVENLPCSVLDAKSFIVNGLKIAEDGE